MSLTKKHYEAIAAIIGSTYNNAKLYTLPNYKDTARARCETLEIAASRMADYFASDNPKFNRVRFLQACGVEQSPVCEHLVKTAIYKDRKLQGAQCNQCGEIVRLSNQK